ncbi:unnamed protein product, partial [Meganyctiphanes norvegica]
YKNNGFGQLQTQSLADNRVPTLKTLCLRKLQQSKSEGLVSSSTLSGDREEGSIHNSPPSVQPITNYNQNVPDPSHSKRSYDHKEDTQVKGSYNENHLLYQRQLLQHVPPLPYIYQHHPSLIKPFGSNIHPYLMNYNQHPYYSHLLQNVSKKPTDSHFQSHVPTEINSQGYAISQSPKLISKVPDFHQYPPLSSNSHKPIIKSKFEEIISQQHQLAVEKRRNLENLERFYSHTRYQEIQQLLQQKQQKQYQHTDLQHQPVQNETSHFHREGSAFNPIPPRVQEKPENSASHTRQNIAYPIPTKIPPQHLQHPYYNLQRDPNRAYTHHELSYYYGQNYEHPGMTHPSHQAAISRLPDDTLHYLISGRQGGNPIHSQVSPPVQQLSNIQDSNHALPNMRQMQFLIVDKDLICYTCQKLVNPFNAVAHLYFGPVKCLDCGKRLSCLEPADIERNSCPHKPVEFIYTNPLIYLIKYLPSRLKLSSDLFVEYLKKVMPVCKFHPWRKQFQKLIISIKITSQALITTDKNDNGKVKFKPNGYFWTANEENIELFKLLNDNESLSLSKIFEEITKYITDQELLNALRPNTLTDNNTKASNLHNNGNRYDLKTQKPSFKDQIADDDKQPIEVDICSSDDEIPLQIVEDDDQVSKENNKIKRKQEKVRHSYHSVNDLPEKYELIDETAFINGIKSRIKVQIDNNTFLKKDKEKLITAEEEPIIEINIPEDDILVASVKHPIHSENSLTANRKYSIDSIKSESQVGGNNYGGKDFVTKSIDIKDEKSKKYSVSNEDSNAIKAIQNNKDDLLVSVTNIEIKDEKSKTQIDKHRNRKNGKLSLIPSTVIHNVNKKKNQKKTVTSSRGKNPAIRKR